MSHRTVIITSIVKIGLQFDSKNLKLDHGMKNNHLVSLSIKLLTLKQSTSFWKLPKIGQKLGIKDKSTGHTKIKVIYLDNLFFSFLLKFEAKLEFQIDCHVSSNKWYTHSFQQENLRVTLKCSEWKLTMRRKAILSLFSQNILKSFQWEPFPVQCT